MIMFQLGIERIGEFEGVFRGKRLGLITSPSGTDTRLRSSAGLLRERFRLLALYGPEHGVRGAADAGELVDEPPRDPRTGLPVYSLYRKDGQSMTAGMVADVDALVYDIQDLGLRFYTYISTLLGALRDCARFQKELIVLDRPAPLGGAYVEGGLLRGGFESFVGCCKIPIRYGLTAGEFARMANVELGIGCALTVVPMSGWRRDFLFPELGYPFLMPSPSIPNFHNAVLYAGTCLVEGTNLSEGRGTADPFALIGAPYVDALRLCAAVEALGLPGLIATPAYFTPTAGKHAGTPCQGVHLHLTYARCYSAVRAGVLLIDLVRSLWPDDFAFNPPQPGQSLPAIDLLSGSAELREGWPVNALLDEWEAESAAFQCRTETYYLY